MFTKLVKHEFRATRRFIPFVYLVTVVTLLGNMAARQLNIPWLDGLLMFFLVLLGIGLVIITYALILTRYYKSMHGQEGYLTHTLPVKARSLLASKLLVSFVWLTLSYVVAGGVFAYIAGLGMSESQIRFSDLPQILASEMGLQVNVLYSLVVVFGVYILFGIFYSLCEFFFAISLGSTARFHPLGIAGPIVVYLITNFVLQLFVLASLMLVPLGITVEQGRFRFVPQGMIRMIQQPDQFVFGAGSMIVMLAIVIGLLVATGHVLRRHVSLR